MKRIIVPTDFSEFAESAYKVASTLARNAKVEVVLVHGLQTNAPEQMMEVKQFMIFQKNLFKSIENELNSIIKHEVFEGVKLSYDLFSNETLVDGIKGICREGDLVIMGTHGAGGWQHYFLGSQTQKMVRECPVPVLAVPIMVEDFNPKQILFCSTFTSQNNTHATLEKLGNMAWWFNSSIHLHRITKSAIAPFDLGEWKDLVKNHYAEFSQSILKVDESVEDAILEQAKKIEADLLVLETHGRHGISHALLGSISEYVVNHAHIPVLVGKVSDSSN